MTTHKITSKLNRRFTQETPTDKEVLTGIKEDKNDVLSGKTETGPEKSTENKLSDSNFNSQFIRDNEKKKGKKRKENVIKDKATTNLSFPTRDRLKKFCVENNFVITNWVDETLWRAMDKFEKAKTKQD